MLSTAIERQAGAHQAFIDRQADLADDRDAAQLAAEASIKARLAEDGSRVSAILWDHDCTNDFFDRLDALWRLYGAGADGQQLLVELLTLMDRTVESAAREAIDTEARR